MVFQADRKKGAASLVACGNAASAAAAVLGEMADTKHLRQLLHLPGETLEAVSRLQPLQDGWTVEQTWKGCRFQVIGASLCGRQVAICRGTFNDYLIVRFHGRQAVETVDLQQIQKLWQAARPWGFHDPLRARLVAVAPHQPYPWAQFFTCGRLHPGAPLTGLATLALAAPQIDWLSEILGDNTIAHARGQDVLPMVLASGQTAAVRFPAIGVEVRPQHIFARN
jgi:hypothetical protein